LENQVTTTSRLYPKDPEDLQGSKAARPSMQQAAAAILADVQSYV
jgi:hypothetical protein